MGNYSESRTVEADCKVQLSRRSHHASVLEVSCDHTGRLCPSPKKNKVVFKVLLPHGNHFVRENVK